MYQFPLYFYPARTTGYDCFANLDTHVQNISLDSSMFLCQKNAIYSIPRPHSTAAQWVNMTQISAILAPNH